MYERIFKKGDRIQALTSSLERGAQKRRAEEKYIVKDTLNCPITGKQFINIGQEEFFSTGKFHCHHCGELHNNKGLAWTSIDQFKRIGRNGKNTYISKHENNRRRKIIDFN